MARKRKYSLAPIDAVEVECDSEDVSLDTFEENNNTVDFSPPSDSEMIAVGDSIDAYINESPQSEKNEEKNEKLSRENDSLKSEISRIKEENENLIKKINSLTDEYNNIKNKFKMLDEENDSNILKNSELELEISQLKTKINKSNTVHNIQRVQEPKQFEPKRKNTRNGLNGYQEWI